MHRNNRAYVAGCPENFSLIAHNKTTLQAGADRSSVPASLLKKLILRDTRQGLSLWRDIDGCDKMKDDTRPKPQ